MSAAPFRAVDGASRPNGREAVTESCQSVRRPDHRQGELTINVEVIARHTLRGESLLEAGTHHASIQHSQPLDGNDRLLLVIDNESSDALVDHFRNRSALKGYNRRFPMPSILS